MFKKIKNKLITKSAKVESVKVESDEKAIVDCSLNDEFLPLQSKKQQPAVFVHLPKTAGTSFRNALEKHFNVVNDYGVDAAETTAQIRELAYGESADLYKLQQWFLNENAWLCGHYPLIKYSNFARVDRLVTFVREPVSQIISHYNHFKNHKDYNGDLESFVKNPSFRNLQARMLANVPLGLIGHVGITKSYQESVDLVNHHLKMNLPVLTSNASKHKVLSTDSISEQQHQVIKNHNGRELALYKHCVWLHESRYKLFKEGKPWVYGFAAINPNNVLHGVAFYDDNDDVVELSIVIDNKVVATVIAEHLHHGHGGLIFPRNRYVAYNFRLNALNDDVFIDKTINVVVKNTGQQVNFNQLKVM